MRGVLLSAFFIHKTEIKKQYTYYTTNKSQFHETEKCNTGGGAVRRDSQTKKITKTETKVVKKSSNSKERKGVTMSDQFNIIVKVANLLVR